MSESYKSPARAAVTDKSSYKLQRRGHGQPRTAGSAEIHVKENERFMVDMTSDTFPPIIDSMAQPCARAAHAA